MSKIPLATKVSPKKPVISEDGIDFVPGMTGYIWNNSCQEYTVRFQCPNSMTVSNVKISENDIEIIGGTEE